LTSGSSIEKQLTFYQTNSFLLGFYLELLVILMVEVGMGFDVDWQEQQELQLRLIVLSRNIQ
jgi:hypothetical protein